jgi:hypothetical protein
MGLVVEDGLWKDITGLVQMGVRESYKFAASQQAQHKSGLRVAF